MNKMLILLFCMIQFFSIFSYAGAEDAPCAVVTKTAKGVQLIPEKGKVDTKAALDTGISCGSMVITHAEPLWIKLSDQTLVKLGPETFVELPKGSTKNYKIYRGMVMVSGPTSLLAQIWSTPNAEVDYRGGVSVIQYLSKEKATLAGCFNRKIEFRNKFNSSAVQELSAGEMSHLAIQEGRVQPSRPSLMHQDSVTDVLVRLGVPKGDQDQMVAVVKQVFEDRSKSLVTEVKDWADQDQGPSRSIASVPQSSKSAIDEKEAAFTMKMLKDRLYGTDPEQQKFVPAPHAYRTPASVMSDVEQDSKEKKLKMETKRIGKEIDRLDPNSMD